MPEPVTLFPYAESALRKLIREELIAALSGRDPYPTEQSDQLLTVDQFAEFATLAKSTIYGMVSKGEIENLKRGKRVYFEKRVVLAYLKAGRRKSYSQLAEEGRK
jgi:excisionase family DNA binding protein